MPIITDRKQVLGIYREAEANRWVLPCLCTENLTTTEAILEAAREYGDEKGIRDLPIIVAITNLYNHRFQTNRGSSSCHPVWGDTREYSRYACPFTFPSSSTMVALQPDVPISIPKRDILPPPPLMALFRSPFLYCGLPVPELQIHPYHLFHFMENDVLPIGCGEKIKGCQLLG
jgi:hypothetical protein